MATPPASSKILTNNVTTAAIKSGVTGSAASTASGIAGMASILAMGAFNTPEGGMSASKKINDARIQTKYDTDIAPTLEASRAPSIPAGMSVLAYNQSRQPPQTPMQLGEESIWQNDEGDKDNQIDENYQRYQTGGSGQAEMDAFYKANPLWYNANGTRTDYAGPYAPPISVQNQQAVDNFGVGNASKNQPLDSPIRNLTPTPGSIADGGTTVNTGVNDMTGGGSSGAGGSTPDVVEPRVIGSGAAEATTNADGTSSVIDPQMPNGAEFQFTAQQAADNEFNTTEGKILGAAAISSGDDIALQAAQAKDLGIIDVTTIGDNIPDLESIRTLLGPDSTMEDVESVVSERYLQQDAANKQMINDFQVFQGSSVKEQYGMLQDDWVGTDGSNKVPFYALGAVTAAKQEMAARGMGGSSMAAAAITQAGLEAMMPVAMADAKFMQTLSIKSFDFQTTMGLAKLSHIANLDVSDLEYRQRQAVDTANKFFEVDMSNVNNDRLVAATNNANRMQTLFSDQNFMNVAANLQFTTQAEQDRFYDNLSLQAQEATSRLTLNNNQFNASVTNSRDEFNSRMSAEIEMDNVNYLRSINTANTAGENQQNLVNSQNLLGISNTAIANGITLQRDQLNRIFESSENVKTRANNYAIAKLSADAAMDRLDATQSFENSQDLGGFLGGIAKPFVDSGVDWALDGIFGGGGGVSDTISDGLSGGDFGSVAGELFS